MLRDSGAALGDWRREARPERFRAGHYLPLRMWGLAGTVRRGRKHRYPHYMPRQEGRYGLAVH